MCSKTTLTNTSGTQITYCAGFQKNYSWSQTNNSYIPQINNVQGNTFTVVIGHLVAQVKILDLVHPEQVTIQVVT